MTTNICNTEFAKTMGELGETGNPPPTIFLGGLSQQMKTNMCDLTLGTPSHPDSYHWGTCPPGYEETTTGQSGQSCFVNNGSSFGNFNWACPEGSASDRDTGYSEAPWGPCYKQCTLRENNNAHDEEMNPLYHQILPSEGAPDNYEENIAKAIDCCTGVTAAKPVPDISDSGCGDMLQGTPPDGYPIPTGGVCSDDTNRCTTVFNDYCGSDAENQADKFKSDGQCYSYYKKKNDLPGNPGTHPSDKTTLLSFCMDKAPHVIKTGMSSNSTSTDDYYYVNPTSIMAISDNTEEQLSHKNQYISDYEDTCACFYPADFYQAFIQKVKADANSDGNTTMRLENNVAAKPDCLYPKCADSWVGTGNAISGPLPSKNECGNNCSVTCIQNSSVSVGGSITNASIQISGAQDCNANCGGGSGITHHTPAGGGGAAAAAAAAAAGSDGGDDGGGDDGDDGDGDDGGTTLPFTDIMGIVVVVIVLGGGAYYMSTREDSGGQSGAGGRRGKGLSKVWRKYKLLIALLVAIVLIHIALRFL